MNPIRKKILNTLIQNLEQKYSQLKPKDLDPKLFIYHLNSLIIEDLIIKNEKGLYQLTPKGRLFAEQLSQKNLQQRIQPKIATMIICQNKKGEYLLYKRAIEPLKGKIGFPWGKIHIGETVVEAAKRELFEKTHLSLNPKQVGMVYISLYKDHQLISHTFYHLLTCKTMKELPQNSIVFWQQIEKPNNNEYLIWMKDILSLLKKNPLFFLELKYYL